MTNTNISTLRKNIFAMFEQAVKFNQPINVSTKHGNAIILSEEDYKSFLETAYINSIPGLADDIIKESKKPLSEYVTYSEELWHE